MVVVQSHHHHCLHSPHLQGHPVQVSIYLYINLFIYLSFFLYISPLLSLAVSLTPFVSSSGTYNSDIYLSIYASMYIPIHLFYLLSYISIVYLFNYIVFPKKNFCLSIYPLICFSIYSHQINYTCISL